MYALKHNTETLVDGDGIEVLVGYDYDKSEGFYAEEENPGTYVPAMIYTELTSVEVVIKGKGIDILPFMTTYQKDKIISLLQYDEI